MALIKLETTDGYAYCLDCNVMVTPHERQEFVNGGGDIFKVRCGKCITAYRPGPPNPAGLYLVYKRAA